MHKLIHLPVLNSVYEAAIKSSLPTIENTAFICVQHLLYTSVDLFRTLINLGAKPNNIFLIGKHYSTSPAVERQLYEMKIHLQPLTPLKKLGEYEAIIKSDILLMLEKAKYHIANSNIDNIIVLDDGGRCLEFLHQDFFRRIPSIGIEQTTAGIFNQSILNLTIPFIDVATCAAKRHLESEMIANTVLNKIKDKISFLEKNIIYGVIGTGVIGTKIAKELIRNGCNVLLYDKNRNKNIGLKHGFYCNSLEELIKKTKYIFGCTGRDTIEGIKIANLIEGEKFFISCSSEDKEFLSLLKFIQNFNPINHPNPLGDVTYKFSDKNSLTLIKGGFPINFDHTGESVPAINIQLTRGLLLSAIIQSLILLSDYDKTQFKGRVMLHPGLQNFVVQSWSHNCQSAPHLLPIIQRFFNTDWVASHSGGNFYHSQHFSAFLNTFLNQQDKSMHYEAVYV